MSNTTPESPTIAALRKRFAAAGTVPQQQKSEPAVQKNLRLPESAAKRLSNLAKAEGLSQAALMVKALEAYAARANPDQ